MLLRHFVIAQNVCSSTVNRSRNLAYERWLRGENFTKVQVVGKSNVRKSRTACILVVDTHTHTM